MKTNFYQHMVLMPNFLNLSAIFLPLNLAYVVKMES